MNFDKYTDRARGFVQSAQSLALREGHQQFAPEHLLKVLLDDPEGLAAGLIDESPRKRRPDDDERRRYYRLTPVGKRLLEAELSRLTRVVRVARGKRILRDPGVA